LAVDRPIALPGLGPEVGPLFAVPVAGRDRLLGALVVARAVGAEPFAAAELELASGFAAQAGVAVELAEARAEQARVLVLSDRHRIARDLHDQVIQRLFATGLRIQHIADRLAPDPVAEQLTEHVTSLDETINEIRSTIFGLRQPTAAGPDGLRGRITELVEEITEILDAKPQLTISGPLDQVSDDLADDVVLAGREALTNVARHARAHTVAVTLATTDDGWLRLEVRDDGVGIGAAERRSGLINLYERARRHGGTCRVSSAPGGGTQIEWRARLRPEAGQSSSSATMVRGR
jgi:signal transduction histidine kinase